MYVYVKDRTKPSQGNVHKVDVIMNQVNGTKLPVYPTSAGLFDPIRHPSRTFIN